MLRPNADVAVSQKLTQNKPLKMPRNHRSDTAVSMAAATATGQLIGYVRVSTVIKHLMRRPMRYETPGLILSASIETSSAAPHGANNARSRGAARLRPAR
jgi:hypothetical protein